MHIQAGEEQRSSQRKEEEKERRGRFLKDPNVRTRMEYFVVVLCLLSILPSCSSVTSSGECYFNAKVIVFNWWNKAKRGEMPYAAQCWATCEHKGQLFDIGESWLNDECFQCVCFQPFGVGCCEHGKQPVDFPEWCEVIRKPGTCTIAVVMKTNHKLPCLFGRKDHLRLGESPAWKSENDPFF